MKAKVNKTSIQVVQGDIYGLQTGAIVTVTDPNLGLNPKLATLAGPEVQAEADYIGWCDIGSAVVTDAGKLTNVEKIIHAVGPKLAEDRSRGKLARVTWRSLELAEEHGLKSVALPPISVGTLGYPVEASAKIMIEQIIDFTFEKLKSLRTVIICVDDSIPNALQAFESEFKRQLAALKETGEGQVHV
jgi:O-acetyl-ADP-ribose deacetylase